MPTEAIGVLLQLLQGKGYEAQYHQAMSSDYTYEGGTYTVSVRLRGGEQQQLGRSSLTGSSKACSQVSGSGGLGLGL